MPTASATIDFILEQLSGLGPVRAKRMFGGAGIFFDDLMFAIVVDDTLYFKADDDSRGAYEAEDMPAFSYATKDGRRTSMNYWKAPERLFDEPDDMLHFARAALATARRAASAKTKPKRTALSEPVSGKARRPRKPGRRASSSGDDSE
jgi:DNA transformation protein